MGSTGVTWDAVEFGRLSAEGARMLRAARAAIQAHPSRFNMRNWVYPGGTGLAPTCGTTACIGGWCMLAAGREWEGILPLVEALGFQVQRGRMPADLALLFSPPGGEENRDVARAVRNINEFLWSYGYPPEEVPEPVLQEEAVCR